MSAEEAVVRCASCGRVSAMGFRVCPWCQAVMPTGIYAAAALGPGTQIDFGWAVAVLDRQLGEGGMGVVWHAMLHPRGAGGVQPPLEAAIKVLHATFSQQGRMRDLFANEARILASLAHPNVVRFYGLGEHRGANAIAMEFVRGETLGSLIERKAREGTARRSSYGDNVRAIPCLPFARAWHYFQQLLGALAATHALGIVHRDVKPDNVLLRTDGVAKLTDFGIARVPASIGATTGNMIAGTVAYMSPEQIQGRPLDGRSDLYAAGCVLFEMLTGRLPFATEDRSDWLVACDHVQTPPPPLRQFLPQAPHELDDLMAAALAKDPAQRFQSAIAFGDAFRSTLGMPPDTGWIAQQELAAQAARYAQQIAAGQAAELSQARNAVAAAYGR
ncbi:MAG: serine/threonine protein kinase [Myxococcales bacterium]|nr:serine/threonine protein kinase [Myxococcales bacterium]